MGNEKIQFSSKDNGKRNVHFIILLLEPQTIFNKSNQIYRFRNVI